MVALLAGSFGEAREAFYRYCHPFLYGAKCQADNLTVSDLGF